jgi:nitroimidazol reductase NimA-like FMN-containing flavoprotein (pyridoxamine 5'-phosphate oxidase superfamily)
MSNLGPTELTTLKRLPQRGVYDRETIYQILDEGFICHVGFAVDSQPFVIPTGYVRDGDSIYIHGSAASRMLKNLKGGIDICFTATLTDGLVLARSAFHHSFNYRSVVVFGRASIIEDESAKLAAARAFVEHVVPGRWQEARQPTESELRATMVLSLPLAEASAKVRTGPPLDDDDDYGLDVWAGVLPLGIVAGAPLADPRLKPGIRIPDYLRGYDRKEMREKG